MEIDQQQQQTEEQTVIFTTPQRQRAQRSKSFFSTATNVDRHKENYDHLALTFTCTRQYIPISVLTTPVTTFFPNHQSPGSLTIPQNHHLNPLSFPVSPSPPHHSKPAAILPGSADGFALHGLLNVFVLSALSAVVQISYFMQCVGHVKQCTVP